MLRLCFMLLCVLCAAATTWSARTVDSHLGPKDLTRLQKVFVDGLSSNDLQSIFFASLNIETSDAATKQTLCQKIVTLHAESKLNNFEKDYYLIGANKNLRCTAKLAESLLSSVYSSLDGELGTTTEIYYRIATHKALGVEISEAAQTKIVKRLQELLKKDDTLSGLGYSFNAAIQLGPSASFVANRIEDAVVQADEVDGKLLQFEGGLSITALILNGVFGVSKALNKPAPVTAEQAVKFANYLLSRRSVQTAKGAHVLIEALKTISGTEKISPVCVQLIGNGQLDAQSPTLNVAIVDLLGKPLSPAVQSVSAKISVKKDNSVLSEKIQLVSKSSDKTTYAADLSSLKPGRGIYVAELNGDGVYKQKVQFKVLGRVKVQSLELGIAESDASAATRKQSINFPNKLKDTLTADSTQKLLLKAQLVDERDSKPITVHQAFVRLHNKNTDKEIIFVAEQDSSKAYKFDMDVGNQAKNFNYENGLYNIYLTVGDASLSNSFEWLLADVQLKFNQPDGEIKASVVSGPLPEIVHQFRVPDKRPPRIVSDIFTGLCITPLVLLFVFWAKLGINVSNFTLSPSTIGFHLGFGGILALFFVFWLQLNMFQTLRMLIPIAVFTFLCGNRLLRRLYAQRTAKTSVASTS
ncbi:dolichyl-diphosphooligosaccharide--protein glycosyltransferase subunit 2 [Drosophila grimshawi]|uniref:Dolichyl-diphosphooligosaccharide--protein glycosyltransferase subunit 2 n=1 Tax=Drosophila grimshawi TaxID=7222 RepID=B4J9J3_DROGR|nr:dolichyl-diphosphooligosaccharide--protein glycosyltransferase subunit 2 [Drosophila grimshawi]EDW02500.1 GH19852 [Drosophila grimshawi]